jgi:hypothetical protein
MKWLKKHSILSIIISILFITSLVYALTSVEIKSYPGSTNSATVTNNRVSTLAADFFFAIGLGEVADHDDIYVNGYNPTVGTTKEVVTPSSVAGLFPFPSSIATLSVVSTDADDDGDPAGTGARTALIEGLDDNYLEITDTITLNGTTPVNTNIQFFRVNRVEVITSGTSQSNEGIIDVKNGADILARINFTAGQGEGRAQTGVYTVPAGHEFLLCRVFGSTVGGNNAHLHTGIRELDKSWITERHFTLKDSPFSANWTYGKLVPEKADIVLISHATGGGAEVDAGLCGYLRPN